MQGVILYSCIKRHFKSSLGAPSYPRHACALYDAVFMHCMTEAKARRGWRASTHAILFGSCDFMQHSHALPTHQQFNAENSNLHPLPEIRLSISDMPDNSLALIRQLYSWLLSLAINSLVSSDTNWMDSLFSTSLQSLAATSLIEKSIRWSFKDSKR